MTLARDVGVAALLCAIAGTLDWLLNGAGRDMAYYTDIALRFSGLVLAIVLFVALVIRLSLWGLDAGLRRARQSDVRLLIGWNFLQTTRIRFPWGLRLRALRDAWFGDDLAVPARAAWLLLGAAALCAAIPLVGRVPLYDPVATRWLARLPLFVAVPLALRALAHLALRPATAALRRERLEAARGLSGGRTRRSVPVSVFVSVVGISVGVWALVVVISVLSGFQNDLKDKLIRHHPNLEVSSRLANAGLPDWEGLARRLSADPAVTAVLPIVGAEAMVASPSNLNVNITVNGVDPLAYEASGPLRGELRRGRFRDLAEPERRLSDTRLDNLLTRATRPAEGSPVEGSGPEAPAPAGPGSIFAAAPRAEGPRPGIVLGLELARSLHVEPGSLVDLISPEGELSPAGLIPRSRSFEVVAIFGTGLYEYDLKTVFVARDEAARFFGVGVNRLQARLGDLSETDRVHQAVAALVPEGVVVRDWKQFNKNLFSALALEKLAMLIVLGFIILVASFNIMSSLATVILQKTRDIAILRSMGMSRSAILGTFRRIGLVVGLFGAVGGSALGWVSCSFIDAWGIRPPVQLYVDKLPVDLEPLIVLAIAAATVALSYVATLVPAHRAAALAPTEGLRYE
jgi:lipoprotein-releasing system permease protein